MFNRYPSSTLEAGRSIPVGQMKSPRAKLKLDALETPAEPVRAWPVRSEPLTTTTIVRARRASLVEVQVALLLRERQLWVAATGNRHLGAFLELGVVAPDACDRPHPRHRVRIAGPKQVANTADKGYGLCE